MKLYIGKMHLVVGECDKDNFDSLFPAKSEAQLIEDVTRHMADWCNNIELLEEANTVMEVKSIDELTAWFDNNFATFSFEMEIIEL